MEINETLTEVKSNNLSIKEKIKVTLDKIMEVQAEPDPDLQNDGFRYPFRLKAYKLISTCLDECCKGTSSIKIHKFNLKGAFDDDDKELYFVESIEDDVVYEIHDVMKYYYLDAHSWFQKFCIKLNLIEDVVSENDSPNKFFDYLKDIADEYDNIIQGYMGKGETEEETLIKLSTGHKFNILDSEEDINMRELEYFGMVKALLKILELHCWEYDTDYFFEEEEEESDPAYFKIEIDRSTTIWAYKYYNELRKTNSILDSRKKLIKNIEQFSQSRLHYFENLPIAVHVDHIWMHRIVPNH